MAIDPDLIPILEQIDGQLTELSEQVTDHAHRLLRLETSNPASLPYRVFGPDVTAEQLNTVMAGMWRDDNGGLIMVDGEDRDLNMSEPIVIVPGVALVGVGEPMMYHKARTRFVPQHNEPVFILDNGNAVGKREAWGGPTLRNVQIHATREGVTGIYHRSGDNATVENVMSSLGRWPLYRGLQIGSISDRPGDRQYSRYHRVKFTRAEHCLDVLANSPDSVFTECMFYGPSSVGSTGVRIGERCNNLKFYECHTQFVDKGWLLEGWETVIRGGSWELKSTSPNGWAEYAYKIAGTVKSLVVDTVSISNHNKVRDVWQIHPDAREWVFHNVLYQGPLKQKIPAGYEDHFVWPP